MIGARSPDKDRDVQVSLAVVLVTVAELAGAARGDCV
jgi:hypothetical protein